MLSLRSRIIKQTSKQNKKVNNRCKIHLATWRSFELLSGFSGGTRTIVTGDPLTYRTTRVEMNPVQARVLSIIRIPTYIPHIRFVSGGGKKPCSDLR